MLARTQTFEMGVGGGRGVRGDASAKYMSIWGPKFIILGIFYIADFFYA